MAHVKKNENLKVMKENNQGKPLPNTEFKDYYNSHNKPYTQYESGYGVDENTMQSNYDYESQQREIVSNCNRLSEVLNY